MRYIFGKKAYSATFLLLIILPLGIIVVFSGRISAKAKSLVELAATNSLMLPQTSQVKASPMLNKIAKENEKLVSKMLKAEENAQKKILVADKRISSLNNENSRKRKKADRLLNEKLGTMQREHTKTMSKMGKKLKFRMNDVKKEVSSEIARMEREKKRRQAEIMNHMVDEASVDLGRDNDTSDIAGESLEFFDDKFVLPEKPQVLQLKGLDASVVQRVVSPRTKEQVLAAGITPEELLVLNRELDVWKQEQRKKIGVVKEYLIPFFQSDDDLEGLLSLKEQTIDMKISDTSKIGDSNYSQVLDEINPLSRLVDIHKDALKHVEKMIKESKLDEVDKLDVNKAIFEKITPLAVSSEEVSLDKIKNIVIESMDQVQPYKLRRQNSDAYREIESLKKKVESLSETNLALQVDLSKSKKDTIQLEKTSRMVDKGIKDLELKTKKLNEEKISLSVQCRRAEKELSKNKSLSENKIKKMETRLGEIQKQFEEKSKKQLELGILLSKNKYEVAAAKDAEREKNKKIFDLEGKIKESNEKYLKAEKDSEKVVDLKQKLEDLKDSLKKAASEKDKAEKTAKDRRDDIKNIKLQLRLENNLHKAKFSRLAVERSKLMNELLAFKISSSEISRIKAEIDKIVSGAKDLMNPGYTIKDLREKILQKDSVREGSELAIRNQKGKMSDQIDEIKNVGEKLGKLQESASSKIEEFKKQKVKSDIEYKKMISRADSKMINLIKQMRQDVPSMGSKPEEDLLQEIIDKDSDLNLHASSDEKMALEAEIEDHEFKSILQSQDDVSSGLNNNSDDESEDSW
jgi:hypothetical protein